MIISPLDEGICVQKHFRRQNAAIYTPIHIGYRSSLARFLDDLFRALC